MQTVNIITKLKVLVALPLIVILIGLILFVLKSNKTLMQMNQLEQDVVQIVNTLNLVNELQKERGISSGYLGSKGNFFDKNLLEQQKNTDRAFQIFLESCETEKDGYEKLKKEILTIREHIANQSIRNIEAFDFYTEKIKRMLNRHLKIAMKVQNSDIKNYLHGYANLSIMKESLGRIRGAFNGIFTKGKTDELLLYRVIYAKGIYDAALHKFLFIASKEITDAYHVLDASQEYKEVKHRIKRYSQRNIESMDVDPYCWWEKMTVVIEKHHELEQQYASLIDKRVKQNYKDTIRGLLFNALLFFLLSIIILWLGLKVKNSILRNLSLLNEYKNAVDRSTIVSKTDIRGVITYANSKFCEISGYEEHELLGKPHNIIRHPDMPKEAFAQMWKQILNKQAWTGIVKNRKKDGSHYIVEATISPILDHKGEIEEFIAIRNDMTEAIELHKEIENTQKDLILKIGEVVEQRSAETGFHVRRVAEYSSLFGKYYGLSSREIEHLTLASPMHDVGKVGIPDRILNKPGKLTDEEWETMKGHTKIGYDLFKDSNKPLLKAVAVVAHEHHEKYDGTGYPRGLKGEEIHIFGRISALADVLDALGSDRVYKRAWDEKAIEKYIREERAKHFDPDLVDIFFAHLDEFMQIKKKFNDTTNGTF